VKKISPSILLLFLLFSLFNYSGIHGQDISKYSFKFTITVLDKNMPLTQLDSLTLTDINSGKKDVFFALKNEHGEFKLENISVGKYSARFFKMGTKFAIETISICSLCENKEAIFILSSAYENQILDRVWIDPRYKKGEKQLSFDIQESFSENEKSELREIGNSLVAKCFITKDGKMSDLVIEPLNISEKLKDKLMKVLESLNGWQGAINNGKFSDGFITIPIHSLLK
jgi:hypothetical protein